MLWEDSHSIHTVDIQLKGIGGLCGQIGCNTRVITGVFIRDVRYKQSRRELIVGYDLYFLLFGRTGMSSFVNSITRGGSPSTTAQVMRTLIPSFKFGGGRNGLITGATNTLMYSSFWAELDVPLTTHRYQCWSLCESTPDMISVPFDILFCLWFCGSFVKPLICRLNHAIDSIGYPLKGQSTWTVCPAMAVMLDICLTNTGPKILTFILWLTECISLEALHSYLRNVGHSCKQSLIINK